MVLKPLTCAEQQRFTIILINSSQKLVWKSISYCFNMNNAVCWCATVPSQVTQCQARQIDPNTSSCSFVSGSKEKKKHKTYFPWMADCLNKQQNCDTNAYLRVLLRNLCNSRYINKTLDVSVIFQSVLSCAEQQRMRWSPAAVANAFPADGNNRRHHIIWMLELIPAAAHFTTGHKLHEYPEEESSRTMVESTIAKLSMSICAQSTVTITKLLHFASSKNGHWATFL